MIPIAKGLYFDVELGLILYLQEHNVEVPKHIQLDAKLTQLFHLLLLKQGELISRDAFIEAVWEGNKWVGQKALTRNISRLRVLLKEHGLEGLCQIKTFPKKGYALLIDGLDSQVPIKTRPMGGVRRRAWVAFSALVLAVGFLALFMTSVHIEEEEDYELILLKEDQTPIFEDIVQYD